MLIRTKVGMHGCGSGSAVLVNAEVDSMGGVVDGGVGIGIKTSPRHAAIEKAQVELRQEYDVREERRRELEFLEKGGNPLDFKFGNAASVSVQSTSLTDQRAEHFVNSEAKGSFALTASPHGDSVESIGRPGAVTVCEPNTADNFDGENELLEGERKPKQSSRRSTVAPSEQSCQMDGTQNAKESEDSAIVRPYARRNRSRPNRDGARSSSNDVLQGSGAHGYSSVRGGSRDVKGLILEGSEQKNQINPSLPIPNFPTSNGDLVPRVETCNTQSNMELDHVQVGQAVSSPKCNFAGDGSDVAGYNMLQVKHDQSLESDAQKTPAEMASNEGDHVEGKEHVHSASAECPPTEVMGRVEHEIGSTLLNGYNDQKGDCNDVQIGIVAVGTKDSESSSTLNNQGLEVNNDGDLGIDRGTNDANEIVGKQTSEVEGLHDVVGNNLGNEKNDDAKTADNNLAVNNGYNQVNQNHSGSGSVVKNEDEVKSSDLQNDIKCMAGIEGREQSDCFPSEANKGLEDGSLFNQESICPGVPLASMDIPAQELHNSTMTEEKSFGAPEPELCPDKGLKVVDRAHEDSVLEEARMIEAKRKRIAELSVLSVSAESRRKSHWDFVLEEMAWLANDFAQERLWKMTAAAQICHRVAFTSRLRFEEQNQHEKLKRVAYTLAKAVMQFWQSAETLLNKDDKITALKKCKRDFKGSDGGEISKSKSRELDKETFDEFERQHPGKASANAIQEYAVRFLRCNCSLVSSLQAEAPTTPDRVVDSGIIEVSWDDHLTEESLFYAVPSVAMQTYRRSIEYHVMQSEKTGSSMQEEVDTSMHESVADFGYPENQYIEEEGETGTYYFQGAVEGSKSTKHDHKKQKNFMRTYSARSYEQGSDMPFGHCTMGSQPNIILGKRPANNYSVGPVPPKRSRTASRQRVIGPFNPGATGAPQAPSKADASSGDTSSFQDDQSTLHCGSQLQKSVEVESAADFEKQLPYDCTETSTKPRKKKKAKHLGSAYEYGWPLDSTVPNEQRDSSKKRLEGHHFDSNGTGGLYGQPAAKKPKLVKQALDGTFDNMAPMTGSVPSPAASQMSNMSNTNKFMRLFNGGRDRGRKAKSQKISSRQSGSGSPWSLFEDQALVVLVHDMGPNWELVSDAINSTLRFKCIFRKPKECKERHKSLMDKGAGDGADSAEDSGSSPSYPSTLPGIPKGSARQLFQRLQEPMEEDTLKSHFEKIIMIGKKQYYWRSQIDHQDLKQPVPPHNSHVIALSQVCLNNGGVLAPLDLCDTSASSPDLGYQGSHGNNLAISNQGALAPMLPASGVNASVQGSPGMVLGNNSPSPSGSHNISGRYSIPRTPLPGDEQQRMQHYNQMLSARSLQQPNLSVPGSLPGADRGVRMLPSGNGMGLMPVMNRNVPISRPGLQGMTSSPMLNPGSVISSGMVGVQNPVNLHSGSGSGQGNSMMRPRDTLQMMRPAHNKEHQRQMMSPEHQVHATQGNGQGIPAFNGLSSAYANQTIPPPGQTYSGHQQHHHQMSPQQSHVLSSPHHPHLQGANHTPSQQQAFAMRYAKERQRFLQQQHQLAASGALMPHVQAQSQLPISSSMQNSNQIQPQPSSQAVSLSPLTPSSPMTPVSMAQQQQKHNLPHHGLSRSSQGVSSGLTNQVGKQRHRQPLQQQFQQSGRHHPQQRQHSQSPRQSKALNGMGRGNMMVHQNLLIDHSHLNGVSLPPGNSEKGEQIMHSMQGQGVYSGPGLSGVQTSKTSVPPSSNHSHAPFSASAPLSSKQTQQMPSHSDNNSQSPGLPGTSSHAQSSTHQAAPSPMMVSNHQHLQPQPHQKQVSQAQPNVQRLVQPNRQMNPDMPTKSHSDQGHVDQQLMNDVSQSSTNTTVTIPQASSDSANAMPVVSPAATQQWNLSETLLDSVVPNPISQVGSNGSPLLAKLGGSEPMVSVHQSLGQRQLSGGLPQHGHGPVSKVIPSQPLFHTQDQQQQSPQKQLPLQQQPQQQTPHLQ